jgi:hypothetical protein
MVKAFVVFEVTVAEPPRLIELPLTVIALFVSDPLAILDNVFVAPLIDLFVSVSVVSLPTNVVVAVGNVTVPVFEIDDITGVVNVLFVSV